MKFSGKVLVADMNKGLSTALSLLIGKECGSCIMEADKEKILFLANEDSIDIIILDSGNGTVQEEGETLQLVKNIVSLGKDIPIILLTNFAHSKFGLECVEAGAFDFFPKPWNNEKLIAGLRNAGKMRKYAIMLKQAGILQENTVTDKWESNTSEGDTLLYEEMAGKVLTIAQMEAKMMKAALKRNMGNISLAARDLGITRQTFYNKGEKYNLFK